MNSPVVYEWTGEAMKPWKRFDNLAKSQFTAGDHYRLEEVTERSMKSHNHFFAVVHDAWENLPEIYGQEFPSSEHLRKWCLIKNGFYNIEKWVLISEDEAVRFATDCRQKDDFAVVKVIENIVNIATAKSQKARGPDKMPPDEFQKSKQAVLDTLEDMLQIDRGSLMADGGSAA